MSLYAIGDLHLHFQSELKAPGQLNSPVWKNHEITFRKNCLSMVRPEDTLVLLGDHSWGRNWAECQKDYDYICALPGRKILLRGNHDMIWDAKKTPQLNERFEGKLRFLQDNYYPYKDFALVGTKGFTFEGPFYVNAQRKVLGWDEDAFFHAQKLVERESLRLRASFEAAKKDGFKKFILFLHYPPTNILEKESVFTAIAQEYGASQVIYAHCHGRSRFHDSLMGDVNGIQYHLASGDYLEWVPLKVL